MKMQIIRLFVILVTTGVLVSCTNVTYNNATYQTPDAALNALRSDTSAYLATFQEFTNPIGGRAKIVVPN